ncbi:hypothetical protein QQ045_013054 [Rhodiola kirilowii]
MDVFIPARERKATRSRFGFVRYKTKVEAVAVIKRWNGANVGGAKLVVSLADDEDKPRGRPRPGRNGERRAGGVLRVGGAKAAWSPKADRADKPTGGSEDAKKAVGGQNQNRRRVKLWSYPEFEVWVQNTLVAEMKTLKLGELIEKEMRLEGIAFVKIVPLGGRNVLIQFDSTEDLEKCLVEDYRAILSNFSKMQRWREELMPISRSMWISIIGLPFKAWTERNCERLAAPYGVCLKLDDQDVRFFGVGRARMLLETRWVERISEYIEAEIDGRWYEIRICEECCLGGCEIDKPQSLEVESEGGVGRDSLLLRSRNPGSRLSRHKTQAEMESKKGRKIAVAKKASLAAESRNTVSPTQAVPESDLQEEATSWVSKLNQDSMEIAKTGGLVERETREEFQEKGIEKAVIISPMSDRATSIGEKQIDKDISEVSEQDVSLALSEKYLNILKSPRRMESKERRDIRYQRRKSLQAIGTVQTKVARSDPGLKSIEEESEAEKGMRCRKMHLLSWNIRGANGRKKQQAISALRRTRSMDMTFIQETKIGKHDERVVAAMWGGEKMCWRCVDAEGSSGGLLTIWDPGFMQLRDEVMGKGFIMVQGEVMCDHQPALINFLNVYAPCGDKEKAMLWEHLVSLKSLYEGEWVAGGDFNSVLIEEERRGFSFSEKEAFLFQDFSRAMGLVDIPLRGKKFTWSNKNGASRLDRFLLSPRVLSLWPKLDQKGLNKEKPGWKGYTLQRKLSRVRVKLAQWNRRGFGDINYKLREARKVWERLASKQDLIGLSEEDSLKKAALQKRIWHLELQEERLWSQKSRIAWIKEGDQNTKFFHRSASWRSSKNKISSILVDGKWLDDPGLIKQAAQDHFGAIFRNSDTGTWELEDMHFSVLNELQKEELERCFGEEEIQQALMECDGNKAPGLDGFNMNFYKKYWHIVGDEVRANRNILDGIMVTNELIHALKTEKRQGLVIKLNFKKAYDSVSWNYLEMIQRSMGFGCKWIGWMAECYSTARLAVLINGSPSKEFTMKRGLRQGDPLSPFLFLVAAEGLSRTLHKAVEEGVISGLEWSNNGDKLSHLQFADDTVLFCRVDALEVQNLRAILIAFEGCSGLKINFDKSLCFGIGLKEEEGCPVGGFPMKYLGMQVGVNPTKRSIWEPIIQKFSDKLASWRGANLSMAGRLVLIKSALCSLPLYYASLYKIPNSVAQEMEKIQRQFLWGGLEGRRKLHYVKWETVKRPKKFGELGIQSLVEKNVAMLTKWWWQLISGKGGLWRRMIIDKYGFKGLLEPSRVLLNPRRLSNSWKNILAALKGNDEVGVAFREGVKLKLGKGNELSFWEDAWAGEKSFKVDGRWHWNIKFRRVLYQWEEVLRAELMEGLDHLQLKEETDDRVVWSFSSDGRFSTNSLMRAASAIKCKKKGWEIVPTQLWMGIAPPKVEMLIWRIFLESLPSKDLLCKRRILSREEDLFCVLCGWEKETSDHLLIHCEWSWRLWTVCLQWWGCCWVTPQKARCLLESWDLGGLSKSSKRLGRILCYAILWSIWEERNKRCFRNCKRRVEEIVELVKARVAWWAKFRRTKCPYSLSTIKSNIEDVKENC